MTRFLLLLASLFILSPAFAQDMPAAPDVSIRLFSPVSSTSASANTPVGLEITLPEGWHTYWRSPGVAGAPPQLDWKDSQNFGDAKIIWPAPQRFSVEGLESFGYEGKFVLPVMVHAKEAGQPLALRLAASLIVCKDICVPVRKTAILDLPSGEPVATADADAYRAAFAAVPQPAADSGVTLSPLQLDGTSLTFSATRQNGTWQTPDAIVEANDDATGPILFKHPDMQVSGNSVQFTLPLDDPGTAPLLTGKTVTVTLIDGGATGGDSLFAADAQETIKAAAVPALPESAPGELDNRTLLSYMLLALLGGLILNLMLCVLPVLSLKLLSVVTHAGESRARIRLGFLTTALGIFTSFAVLAAVIIGVKTSGGALAQYAGWGVQFQQPLFLSALLAIVLLFTGSMFGWFEFRLPAALQNRLGKPQLQDDAPSLLGEFFSGFLATLLATPCTAPFVGSAVGFAFGTGPLAAALIFLSLGFGLALPYLLIALFPGLARALPRPGRWMQTLRVILGLFLLGTALWVLGLLVIQLGMTAGAALVVTGALLLLALYKRIPAAAILFGVMLLIVPALFTPQPLMMQQTNTQSQLNWQPFEPEKIPAIIARGQTVFIDLTASWCLTCHVNERLVLETDEVREALNTEDVVLMRGDWTRPDPAITDFLKAHGRAGVPFNLVVSPGAPEGVILPEILTKSAVINAVGRTED